MDNDLIELFSYFGFGLVIIGIIFFLFGNKSNARQQSIALGYLAGGFALIVMIFFIENPDMRGISVGKVAIAVIGGIVGLIKLLQRKS